MYLQLTQRYRIKVADGILISGVLVSADTAKNWGELEVEFLGRTWLTSVALSELLPVECNIGLQLATPYPEDKRQKAKAINEKQLGGE